MARITIQDCLKNSQISNHFELAVLAANRAKDIMSGAPLTLETNNNKPPVIALREIAQSTVDCSVLRSKLTQKIRTAHSSMIEIEEESEDSILQEGELMNIDGETLEASDEDIAYSYEDENYSDNIDSIDDDKFTKTTF